MQYRVLGPLEVTHDGVALDLGRPKQRALLAILLVHAGRVVSADRLVDDIWSGNPPANASAALQVQVSRLRQVFSGAGVDGVAVLESRKPGYVLNAKAEDVDAAAFGRLVAEADAALAAGRAVDADDRYAHALALWRGAALAEFADQEFAMAEAARLEECRLRALEAQAEARLARGLHAALIGELRALAAAQPLREQVWAHLMVALYRSGRQADALRTYGELRANLADELGIDPSPALQRLEEAVLLQKPELDWHGGDAPGGAGTTAAAAVADTIPDLADSAGAPFMGREAELATLTGEWDRAGADGPRLVLVAGEPGIGKTRLTMELVGVAQRRGARVLVGRCTEELAVPFEPFAEALGRLFHQLPSADVAALTAGRGAELLRLLPDLADLVPDLVAPAPAEPETERYRMFEAIRRALETLAAHHPLLLVLDDLHWAAAPTVALLRHLVTRSDPMPLLVLGTYRQTEARDVLGEAARSPRVSEVRLEGLDEATVEGLVAALVGHALDDAGLALARRIHDETAGNALFVREMVRHLTESDQPFGTAAPDVPDGVRDIVRRRLTRLSETANRLLAVAAVAGAEFDTRVVGAAAGLDEEATLAGLEEAIAAGLVRDPSDGDARLRFTHALVRAAIDEGLAAPRRAQLHRRVGEAIEAVHARRLEDHLPELAHHFARASAAGGAAKAVDYSARAGAQARSRLAHEEAVAHFAQALALLEGEAATVRCDLLIGLGEAQRLSGDAAHRQTLLDAAAAAEALGDADRLAHAALANTRSFWSATRRVDAERVGALRAALAGLDERGEGDSSLRARLLAKLAVELVYGGDTAAVRQRSDEALAMARRLGDVPTLAAVLLPRYNTIRGDPGTLATRLADTAELLAVAEKAPDPALRAEAWGWRSVAAYEAGDASEGDTAFAAFDRLTAGLRQPTMRWYATYMAAGRAMYAGRFDAAAGLIEEALALGETAGQPDAAMFAFAQRLVLAFERGTLERWGRVLRLAVARDPDPASAWFFRSWQAVRACELEAMEEARDRWSRLAADDFAGLHFEPTWLHVVTNLATVCAFVGDERRAELLAARLDPYAGQVVTLTSLAFGGAVDHYLGLLAACRNQATEACAAFVRAAEIEERMGAPVWVARSQLAWSGCAPDPGDALRLATAALDAASAHGAVAVERHARARVAALGAPSSVSSG